MPSKMHSYESNSSNVPAFLVKLWKLVEDSTCDDLIAWSESGRSFIIKDQTKFSRDLLPQYFKHNNMASFIRQLNMYGFRKVMNYDKSGLRNENNEMEFQHACFVKDQIQSLDYIKRKIPNAKVTEPVVKSNARDILTDLSSIREKQENMDNMLLKMKQENELLWRELTTMRQKHKAQEQIIQKVIQFLVTIVQRGNQNIGVQRKIHRMLHDSPGSKEKQNVTCTIDVLRKKKKKYITVPEDKLASPHGPVIHEVTDFDHEQEENNLSPTVKSPEEKHDENVDDPVFEVQENECPFNSSLNSPINTSVIEPLSILEPLQSSTPTMNSDDCNPEESVLGIPLEYIDSASPCNVVSNVISIPEEPSENAISFPDTVSDIGLSYDINPQDVLVCTSSKSDFEDSLLSESLQTPKIPTIHIEDIYALPAELEANEEEVAETESNMNSQQNEHNYQLALSDSSSALKPSSTLSKNTLSNHLLNVEEKLDWLQNQITFNSWTVDANKLLGLFSADDVANNEMLAGEIAAQSNIKTEPSEIVGTEVVQFTPSMFELDIGSQLLNECINQDLQIPTENISKDSEDQKNFLMVDVLNDANQEAASEAAEYLLSNGSAKHKSSRRPKIQRLQKAKRKKVK